MPIEPIKWIGDSRGGFIKAIDQTRLPLQTIHLELRTVEELREAIMRLAVRGAPLLGIAGAYGVVLGVREAKDSASLMTSLERAADRIASSRPTAVNLFWALKRMRGVAAENAALAADELRGRLLAEACEIHDEDIRMGRAMGQNGLKFVRDGCAYLTHCNAGALATGGYGTALGVFFAAKEAGRKFSVFACETRPLLQGARLTAWELREAGIPVTLITDGTAAMLMKAGKISGVMSGADRIAANGDSANKIGTYSHAVAAKAHGVPFYIVAPSSTFDLSLASGDKIPIEERDAAEVTHFAGVRVAPEGIAVYNPAFDVTPAALITAIVTETGVASPPNGESVAALFKR